MAEHITIGDVAPRVQYVADGVQTDFTYPFPIFAAGDLEVRVDGTLLGSGYAVSGAGRSEGGTASFASPPAAGLTVTLRRRLKLARTTDFRDNAVLRARILNDELDYQTAALQDVAEEVGGAIRVGPAEIGGRMTLPLRAGRANRVLGFDSLGDVTVFTREEGTLAVPHPGGIPRTIEDKLAERLTARDFGAVGDGIADDGPALQAAMNAAGATARLLEIGEGVFRTAMPLRLPGAAAGLAMRGSILYDGPGGHAALTLGEGGATKNQRKRYTGLAVLRLDQSDWVDEEDVGIRLRNIDACLVEIRQAERFTIGVQILGDATGAEDSEITYGRLIDNRIGLDLRCLTAAGWCNSLRHHGGHFACSSGTNQTSARFGVRFSAAPGAYDRHNAHLFLGPAFELQRQGTPGTVDAIPFLLEAADGRGLHVIGARMEACSPFVARVTGGFNDAVFEVGYVGTYGWAGAGVDYAPGATRAGCTVVPRHQAAAAIGTPRLVAEAASLRARAFRWSASETGFEGMALMSSNPSGGRILLDELCFPGLSSLTPGADEVGIPTSRALGFVVDAANCRELFLAAEGTLMRPVVVQFGATETVLGSAAPVLFSNMNVAWSGAPSYWWEGNADLDGLSGGQPLNRLQRVTLHPSCRYAFIGIRGGSAAATLRAIRLFCAGQHAPPVLAGGTRRWGRRELVATAAWDPPSIVASGTATLSVPVPDAVPGDGVAVGYSLATTLPFLGQVSASDTVTVRLWNPSGAAVDVGAGTLFVRVTKPPA